MYRAAALEITSLWKLYRLGRSARLEPFPEPDHLREPIDTPEDALVRHGKAFWALRDVNLVVYQGEAVGLIGRNGAGKSTLLKVLSRVTAPTRGCVRIYGSIASLLEIGTGFHDELTGRENILLNATILGMDARELKDQFERIVDFSGVGDFVDIPVKHLSSGMRVRLGFSVAVHVKPEILIIDEVLAVGDAEFQERCRERIGEIVRARDRTVLVVSHSMSEIEKLCSRVIQMESGTIVADGVPQETIKRYLDQIRSVRGKMVKKRADGL